MLSDKIPCMYDGVTFFCKDPETRIHIMRNQHKYNVHQKLNTDNQIVEINGRYKNFDFKTAFNSKVSGIEFGGSFHKWKNKSHNHDIFYWDEFIPILEEISDEFKLNKNKTDLWSLEFGLNLRSHIITEFNLAYKIPRNIIYLNGDPKRSSKNKYSNKGFKAEMERGSCKSKIYDKGSQFGLSEKILRVESSCKSRQLKKLGLNTYHDLYNKVNHDNYNKHFIKIFQNIIIAQHEILDLPNLPASTREHLLEYNHIEAWLRIKKQSSYRFKKGLDQYQGIIDKYSNINFRAELLKLIRNYPSN